MEVAVRFPSDAGGRSLPVNLGLPIALLLLCAGFGWFVTEMLVLYGESIERRAITATAAAAAASFDQGAVESLKGNEDDQTSLAFSNVRAQLQRIRAAIPDSRFTYLLAWKKGEIVFLADAEPVSSEDYSPPGQAYYEATDLLRGVFIKKQPAVEGPVTDRWGDWVSGLAPIVGSRGNVDAVFGFDISAKNWQATVSRFRWMGISISALATVAMLLFGLFGFKQHKLAAKVRHAASHDALTGLVNRKTFIEELRQRLKRQNGRGVAVLYVDLDYFKDVNDTLGHATGDQLLCAVAGRLHNHVRRTDCVGRIGGDEFAIVIEAKNVATETKRLARRLIAALGKPFEIDGNLIVAGASIGIAICDSRNDNAETLMSHADIALYQAKNDNRGHWKTFTAVMDDEVRNSICVTAELRAALDADQLYLEYQPQVDIQLRRITGIEALVRWRHPKRGALEAAQFVPLAERTGLLLPLDRWVLTEACRQGKAWLDAGIVIKRLAVNISALHFKRAHELERDVLRILAKTGFPPECLELELTETGIMAASTEQDGVLSDLRRQGIHLSIDDFGTGYCSLDYLRRYPADRVKIASTFVKDIATDAGSRTIVSAIIALASQLGMVAVAEGIETADQLREVKECGCPEGQGFYIARPLDLIAITPLLRRGTIPDSQG